MKHVVRRTVFALLITALPLAAVAQEAFTLRDVEVFAGPSSEYPPIAELPSGTAVQVAGCLSNWSWCDVIFANDRGWVYAGDLGCPYEGNRVVIVEYGPRLRLPVVTFALETYWSAHYRPQPQAGQTQGGERERRARPAARQARAVPDAGTTGAASAQCGTPARGHVSARAPAAQGRRPIAVQVPYPRRRDNRQGGATA